MREELEKLNGIRTTFIGTFVRYGKKSRFKPRKEGDSWVDYDITVLLDKIKDVRGKQITDHLWLNYTKGIAILGELQEGTIIQFDARSKPYVKGYVNQREFIDEREMDYKLSNPTKFRKLLGN